MKHVDWAKIIFLFIFCWVFVLYPILFFGKIEASTTEINIPTYITISLCGNGTIEIPELCDDGRALNGTYSLTPEGKYCGSGCDAWGPFCGDSILQAQFDEECDDGNNVSDDACSFDCKEEESTPPSRGGAGGTAGGGGTIIIPTQTKVVIKGKAYPNSEIHVLKQGEEVGVVFANDKADFSFDTSNVTPGVATFGFWAEDKEGIRSIVYTFSFQVLDGVVTTISGVFLPPTIQVDKTSLKKGEALKILGQTVPNSKVYTYINSETEIIKETQTDSLGVWLLNFDTSPLEENAFHTAKSLFQASVSGDTARSGFSKIVSFYIGEKPPEETTYLIADLNRDGKVNLVDFSILLYHWGTSEDLADINKDGKVSLPDFSIMMFHWTG